MPATVLYSENNYPDDSVERRVYGPGINIVLPKRATASLADLTDRRRCLAHRIRIARADTDAQPLGGPRLSRRSGDERAIGSSPLTTR